MSKKEKIKLIKQLAAGNDVRPDIVYKREDGTYFMIESGERVEVPVETAEKALIKAFEYEADL